MVLSILMSVLMWLIKMFAKGTVEAVSLALDGVIKLIQMVPPEEYAKLATALQAFLASLVAKLGTAHPAVKAMMTPAKVAAMTASPSPLVGRGSEANPL